MILRFLDGKELKDSIPAWSFLQIYFYGCKSNKILAVSLILLSIFINIYCCYAVSYADFPRKSAEPNLKSE